jgi:hypothetical protein
MFSALKNVDMAGFINLTGCFMMYFRRNELLRRKPLEKPFGTYIFESLF